MVFVRRGEAAPHSPLLFQIFDLFAPAFVPAALDLATRGYVLQTGRVVLEGSSRELLDSDLVRKAYLGI